MHRTIRLGLAGLAASALLVTTACGGGLSDIAAEGSVPAPQATESTHPLPDTLPSDEAAGEDEEAPAEEEEAEDPLYAFGDTVTYDNGLQVTIGKVKAFKGYSYPEDLKKSQRTVKFTVTVVNGTDKRWDPSEFYVTASSDEKEQTELFDTENGLDGSPSTKLLKGKKRTWTVGYTAQKGGDFVLEVSPNYETEAAIFVS